MAETSKIVLPGDKHISLRSFRAFFITLFGGEDPILTKAKTAINRVSYGLDSEVYIFDFKNYSAQSGGNVLSFLGGTGRVNIRTSGGDLTENVVDGPEITEPVRLKPKDVLNELETVPTPWSLVGIDQKLFVLNDKKKLITQEYALREVDALIERLTNRKGYEKHKDFYNSFQNTTDEKLGVLLEKHKHLVQKGADIFIPEFPDDAVQVMKDYTEKTLDVCGKKPVFYVIAEDSKFQKAYEKRDPILLVQSPFGFYWQILGAWDKEMLLLSEL